MSTTAGARTRRIFTHGTMRLSDPAPDKGPKEVQAILATTYPELVSATLTLTKTEDTDGGKTEHWEFKRSVGTKG